MQQVARIGTMAGLFFLFKHWKFFLSLTREMMKGVKNLTSTTSHSLLGLLVFKLKSESVKMYLFMCGVTKKRQ